MKKIQVCKRCVMDNLADNTITFDSKGFCNYCSEALITMDKVYFPNKEGEKKLQALITKLKNDGKGKKYDCIMGISGGLDSSYLAYLGAVKWGLRILAIHVDDGFNTKITKSNLTKLTSKANIKLVTIKPNQEQFNELTRAYIVAGVPNIAAPQDNIYFASLYKYMRENKIKYFLSGTNFALESILQRDKTHGALDLKNLKDINRKHGRSKINKLHLTSYKKRFFDVLFYRIKTETPLNYIDYNKEKALDELSEFCGFEDYGLKHHENSLTKFTQIYWLFNKFKVDKRKSHLSSMIVSKQLTREDANALLKDKLYDSSYDDELDLLLSKFNLTKKKLDKIVNENNAKHTDYKTSNNKIIKSIILPVYNKIFRKMK